MAENLDDEAEAEIVSHTPNDSRYGQQLEQ